MNFDWSEYLTLANRLFTECESFAEVQKQEALQRAAISRAYYAAFKKAEEFLIQKGEIDSFSNLFQETDANENNDVTRVGSHWRVIRVFIYSTNPNRKKIGNMLKTLKFNRVKADYDGDFAANLRNYTQDSLDKSQKIINSLKSLPRETRKNYR